MLLSENFYLRENVTLIAKELLGKMILSNIEGKITGGWITETEAYAGAIDKASHAYNNRRTKRTEVIFQKGGITYVYLCYGMHFLLNVVTHLKSTPHAVLIRSVIPEIGEEHMENRLGRKTRNSLSGPGVVCKGLGITLEHNGLSLLGNTIWIEDHGNKPKQILQSPRIGVDYAGEDAKLPWRFYTPRDTIRA